MSAIQSAITVFVVLGWCRFVAAATFTVTSPNPSGPGSLRQAILDANSAPGADTVAFNMPGIGVHTITPTSPLPPLSDEAGVTIDGYTQPGSNPNTLAVGNDAGLQIEVNGAMAGSQTIGLDVQSSANVIRGLVINGFARLGVAIQRGRANKVVGCFVGTDPSGSAARSNGSGIGVFFAGENPQDPSATSGTIIGGLTPADRNVVSGNLRDGILTGIGSSNTTVQGNYVGTSANGDAALPNGNSGVNIVDSQNLVGGTSGGARNVISGNRGIGVALGFGGLTSIQGNFIGTDASGTSALPNFTGVRIFDSQLNSIGGTTAAARNVISGNSGRGVEIFGFATTNNAVVGNFIGTDWTGTQPLGNLQQGVYIFGAPAEDNRIGGVEPGSGNVIAFNGVVGVEIGTLGEPATKNRISSNSIHDNGSLGIDLGGDGVSPNDAGDLDAGPNLLQNFPVLTSAVSTSGATTISGTLNTWPLTTFRIEFFSSEVCDPSGFGEGATFLGATDVTTDAGGNANFSAQPPVMIPAGRVVTATATDPNGNTSEFSACHALAFAPDVPIPAFGAFGLVALVLGLAGVGTLVLERMS